MLVRADALAVAGGIDGIRSALIDDCALAKQMKAVGPIWLGLYRAASKASAPYDTFGPIPPHGDALGLCRSCAIRRCCWPPPRWRWR